MLTDFMANPVYVVFNSSPTSGGPANRILGPYRMVRFGGKGIWGWAGWGEESIRIATRPAGSGVSWELDGFPDDPEWGNVTIISPPPGATARDIEAKTGWIKPTD